MPYPPWVMKHKQKGMYVNKVNDSTYRIYRGHSERVKGTKKVKRIVDEYIGTITEKDGLIPTKPKIKGEVRTLRSGGYAILWRFCRANLQRIPQLMGDDAGAAVLASAILQVIYGEASSFLYSCDWVSMAYPDVTFPLTPVLEAEARRVATALRSTLTAVFGEQASLVMHAAAFITRVWVNGQWVNAVVPQACRELAKTYDFRWEV